MLKKGQDFSRTTPLNTAFSEKPMTYWASGKIKRIYDGYGSFCEEIGRLLGEPAKPQVTGTANPEIIAEFEETIQSEAPLEKSQQAITLLSAFFEAGLLIKSDGEVSSVECYFIDAKHEGCLNGPKRKSRFTPQFTSESDLLPIRFGIKQLENALGWGPIFTEEKALALHFWLDPEEGLSLVLISAESEPLRRELFLKAQSLIQRRFYD
jgi:hypothetical protein